MDASALGSVVIPAVCAVAALGWILGIVEALGAWLLSPWAFRLGPVVLRESRVVPLPPPRIRIGEAIETESGMFKLVAGDECLFRARRPAFRWRVETPFPVRGVMRWTGALAEIEGRAPLGATIFFAAWFAGWTLASGMIALASGGGPVALVAVVPLLLGWSFAGIMVAACLPLEKKRALQVLAELEQSLRGERQT